jgi:hypothetical protein
MQAKISKSKGVKKGQKEEKDVESDAPDKQNNDNNIGATQEGIEGNSEEESNNYD